MNKVALYLQDSAARLKKERPGMSLRAVAKRLGVSPSYWSKVLRGERSLSQRMLPRVVKILGLDAQQVAELQRSILQNIENKQMAPATGIQTSAFTAESPVANYKNLCEAEFWLLEEWFHIPILNAVTLNTPPRNDIAEIARRLKISESVARDSLKRLADAGFVRIGADGAVSRTDLQIRFPTRRSHPQVRNYHAAMISKAHQEITKHNSSENFEARLVSSVCFAGSKEKLRAARLILEEAMYRAANLMAQSDECDEIYQLNVQLFPLTK